MQACVAARVHHSSRNPFDLKTPKLRGQHQEVDLPASPRQSAELIRPPESARFSRCLLRDYLCCAENSPVPALKAPWSSYSGNSTSTLRRMRCKFTSPNSSGITSIPLRCLTKLPKIFFITTSLTPRQRTPHTRRVGVTVPRTAY